MTTTSQPSGKRHLGSQQLWLRVCAALAVVALVAAVVFAGIFGYRWIDAAFFGVQDTQEVRDDAQDGAEQVILNVTNIDPKNLTAFREQVDSSLTGNARTQITAEDFETLTKQVDANGDKTATLTSVVKRSGVVEFNEDDKTAKVLVYVDVTSTVPGAQPTTSNMGFSVDVVHEDGGWKATDIQSIDAIGLQDPAGTTTAPTTGGN
ncbi:hypothetical protein [Nocardia sp. 348MFTsu5.1]|uniref:hypothetical protein n=1 Tax=Nocardia sp. 348MFTsu5.1 TaxID=1172185 RepID=UPI00048C66F2|nr:hypothetical protein [Nocardia sp. 348MFTsu5.1]